MKVRTKIITALAALAAVAVVVVLIVTGGGSPDAVGTDQPTPAPAVTQTATPEPEPVVEEVDLDALPLANAPDAEALIPALPVDPDPDGRALPEAVVVSERVAVYDAPGGNAVAVLDPVTVMTGTRLPIFEREGERWAMVPLFARAGTPGEGVTGQAVGWLDTSADGVEVEDNGYAIRVDTAEYTVEVVGLAEDGERVLHREEMVGVGGIGHETSTGRTATAAVWVDDRLRYTLADGEYMPVVALTRFSDTQPRLWVEETGADGGPPMLAFHHYRNTPPGPVSQGCIRVSPELTQVLTELPVGTPVYIS